MNKVHGVSFVKSCCLIPQIVLNKLPSLLKCGSLSHLSNMINLIITFIESEIITMSHQQYLDEIATKMDGVHKQLFS